MTEYSAAINDHYGQSDLSERILTALRDAGKDTDALTRDDISTFDEFHTGGRDATREMAQQLGLANGTVVLDLGCGLGGPARTLAAEFGCIVTGLDLVDEYCRAARMLTERVSLADRVEFRQGDATALPFEDASFDVVWAQHVTMNIEDKPKLFQEIHRVLRNNGRLALYEICEDSGDPIHFPVPWANDPSISFLWRTSALQDLLRETGFREETASDVTAVSTEWFRRALARMASRPKDAAPPLGLNLLMEEATGAKLANVLRNLEEGRIAVLRGVFSRANS